MDSNTPAVVMIAGVVLAIILKIVWDWLASGRIEKGKYMTVEACDKHRDSCCVAALKKDLNDHKNVFFTHAAKIDANMDAVEQRLDEGREEFQLLRKDNSRIIDILSKVQASMDFLLRERELDRRHDS